MWLGEMIGGLEPALCGSWTNGLFLAPGIEGVEQGELVGGRDYEKHRA
jgi:hypothetical protein